MAASADKPNPARHVASTPLPTALLHHRSPEGDHYDWMIADPRENGPDGPLWTARVTMPSREWAKSDTWTIEVIAPHRREFLTYEGPISGNRGSVTRIDEGACVASEWSDNRIEVQVSLRHFSGTLVMLPGERSEWTVKRV
jgi:hypothetical protein